MFYWTKCAVIWGARYVDETDGFRSSFTQYRLYRSAIEKKMSFCFCKGASDAKQSIDWFNIDLIGDSRFSMRVLSSYFRMTLYNFVLDNYLIELSQRLWAAWIDYLQKKTSMVVACLQSRRTLWLATARISDWGAMMNDSHISRQLPIDDWAQLLSEPDAYI